MAALAAALSLAASEMMLLMFLLQLRIGQFVANVVTGDNVVATYWQN